jgi:D-alanyl-lipoteichoic acid acyltransferase DltB (MBOAT superfamily)
MLFNSIPFLIFFPIVIGIYYLLPKKAKTFWLLIASYYFYMSWNVKYVLLILTATVVTYLCAAGIGRARQKGRDSQAKLLVAASFVVTLGILFFFKYFDFFLGTLNRILAPLHLTALRNPFSLLLPVGISFYTFQTLSYVVDVYRGELAPERDFFRYALYVSFFPQLVAGPIERSKNLLSQMQELPRRRLWDYEGVVSGFSMMIWGLFLKMVVADRVSLLVDAVYGDLYAVGTVETVAAAIGFSIQIYADFAGYSIIAVGAARMLGIRLMENFNTPYFATSIADFWQRWHISLSTWFRDYLYIPLGGNRCSKARKYFNIMVTFLVSGLWHGAAWHYVLWGGIHGIYRIAGAITRPLRDRVNDALKVNREVFSFRFGQMLVTFGLTTFAWIFFRAEGAGQAFLFLRRMLTAWNPWALFDGRMYTYGLDRQEMGILMVALAALLVVSLIRYCKGLDFGAFLRRQNLWFRWGVLILLMAVILVCGEYGTDFDSQQFLYFTF